MRREDLPSPAQRAQLITDLINLGINGARLALIITAGKTRGEIWQDLREYAKTRTRG